MNREESVNQFVEDMNLKLRSTPKRTLHGSGTRDGYDAGQRANLGGTSLGNSRQGRINA